MEATSKGTVLLVEDNRKLNNANRRSLELLGYQVAAVETLAEARAWLAENGPDIILLDVILPDGDGFDFCREIRPRTDAHIIFLTAKDQHEEVLRGLADGGDDYIRKPFHPGELLGRIDAAMRRREMDRGKTQQTITRGPLMLDVVADRAYLFGEDMLLSNKEFSLLLFLVQKEGETLDKETVYQTVWGQPLADNSRALYTMVSKLKKKLEPCGNVVQLSAVRGDGYRLEIGR